jgi:hypothetical protein
MANLMNGFATIRGISDGGCTVDVTGYLMAMIDTLPIQLTTDLTEHMGAHGQGPCAMEWRNQRVILEATFKPGSTTSQATAQSKALLIPQGTKVTLDGFKKVGIFGATAGSRDEDILNGEWLHVGPTTTLTLSATVAGEAQLTLGYYFERQTALTTPVPA